MPRWEPTPEQVELLKTGAQHKALAERFGVDPTTVARTRKRLGLQIETSTFRSEVDPVTAEERLQAELDDARRALRHRRSSTVAQERVLRAIETALEDIYPIPYLDLPAPTVDPKDAPHHRQAVLLSDWHAGEVVDPAEVDGLNSFDWGVLESRVEYTVNALLAFQRVRPALTGLDVWILGDMISGDIHDELVATNEFPVAEQSVRVGYLLGQALARLAPHYPEIRVTAIAGNHARTKKGHASKQVFDSWDWAAYQLAAAYTREVANIQWDIPAAGTRVVTIAGRNILLFHGDGIRSSMPGVPWGGIMRRWNELLKQYADAGQRLDGAALGHFHQANVIQGRLFVNGSLIGTNGYGYKNFGGGEAPKQLLLTFDEKRERLTDVGYITPE